MILQQLSMITLSPSYIGSGAPFIFSAPFFYVFQKPQAKLSQSAGK